MLDNPKDKKRGWGFLKREEAKKIVASLNPDLIKEGIASIDNEWLQTYCKNPVDKVLVEFEEITNNTLIGLGIDSMNYKPKLSPNGSIIIKPIVDDWDEIFKKVSFLSKGDFECESKFTEYLKQNYNPPTIKNK